MDSSTRDERFLLAANGVHKSYTVPVLRDFSFDLAAGEVHALVGSNGAGKSTFARILCGLTTLDGGEIRLEGRGWAPKSRREAEQGGIIMVLQELNIIRGLSVAENLFLDRMPRSAGFVRFSDMREKARQALQRVGLGGLDPALPAGELGVGHQQLVEIAGALARNCRVLILDEPTAALTGHEIERLFENIRRLQQEGVGIIYISHRMDEIRRIADRVTVLRDGRRVATHAAREAPPAQLIREMVGHDLPERQAGDRQRGVEVALRVSHLRRGARVRDVSFDVRSGEILGIAGLIGSGRTELLRAIFGADRKESGEIFVRAKSKAGVPPDASRADDARDGRGGAHSAWIERPNLPEPGGDRPLLRTGMSALRPVNIRAPSDAVRTGIGMVPEDRKGLGLLLGQSIRANVTLATLLDHAVGGGWLQTSSETTATDTLCQRLGVRCASYEQPVSELSGGTQQKVLIARWLARRCRVLLFDEPTRGIDVAAKDTIYDLVRALAAEGKAVVVVSSELTELMALCDRILVMSAGTLAGEFLPGQWTQEGITRAAFSGYGAA